MGLVEGFVGSKFMRVEDVAVIFFILVPSFTTQSGSTESVQLGKLYLSLSPNFLVAIV